MYAELKRGFITPARHATFPVEEQTSRRGLIFSATPAAEYLATRTLQAYNTLLEENGDTSQVRLARVRHNQHGEGELIPRLLESADGRDVFLFVAAWDPSFIAKAQERVHASLLCHGYGLSLEQMLDGAEGIDYETPGDSMSQAFSEKVLNANLMEALLYIRMFRANAAAHITAVLPYYSYGRQEKPSNRKRESTTARFVADMLVCAGADGLITYDPHSRALHGMFPEGERFVKKLIDPTNELYAVFEQHKGQQDVQFAYMDPGSIDRYNRLAQELCLAPIFVTKLHTDEGVKRFDIVGLKPGTRRILYADDIFGSGTTIVSGHKALHELWREIRPDIIPEFEAAVSHPLITRNARRQLIELHQQYGLLALHAWDAIPQPRRIRDLPVYKERTVAPILARTINAMHYEVSASQHSYPQE